MIALAPETDADADEVELLLDLAFAPGRRALSSYALRPGPPLAALCRTARDEYGALAGCIRYWPVLAAGAPALLLGPVAAHPTRQGEGVGALLIRQTLEDAARLGWRRVLLVGDAPYYGRFGFAADAVAAIAFPAPTDPARALGRALEAGAFEGLGGPLTAWPAARPVRP